MYGKRAGKFVATGFLCLGVLAGCGDEKKPEPATPAPTPTVAPPANTVPHEGQVPQETKTQPPRPAPRSPVEGYVQKLRSGGMKRHLTGVGPRETSVPPREDATPDDCKERIAARYEECLKTAREEDPNLKHRCDTFRQWFRDRCKSQAPSAPASAPPKAK